MISIVRRPDELTRAEWRQALADLQELGLVRVHIFPSELIDGAVVEVLRRSQFPKLVA